MRPEAPLPYNSHPDRGLPPVAPPSGRFIAQLFLVPGLIVAVAVLVLLGFSWFVGGESAPDELLNRLEDGNPDVRWRAANDLAQRLKRDDELASEPRIGLRLTGILQERLNDYDQAQKAYAERAGMVSEEERNREFQGLKDRRKDIQFLSPCLGNLIIPVGAPLLGDIARRDRGADEKSLALLRRQAVWALGNLGENLKRYDKLPPARRQAVVSAMEAAETTAVADTRTWARQTAEYLREVQEGKPHTSLGVIGALAECARADDPFLREMVAHALNFWEGDSKENALAEKTLVLLTGDKGQGKRLEIGDAD